MYRLAVCLLFITTFQNGIKISLQEDATTTEPEILKKGNSSEPSTKENDVEPVKETDDVSRKENDITIDPTDETEKSTENNATSQYRLKNSQEYPRHSVHGSFKKGLLQNKTKENATDAGNKADDDSRRENFITAGPEDYQEVTTQHSRGKLIENPSRTQEPKIMKKIDHTITTTSKPKHKYVPEDFASKILGPVLQVQARISDTISKGVDGAKDFADEAYKILKETVKRFF